MNLGPDDWVREEVDDISISPYEFQYFDGGLEWR